MKKPIFTGSAVALVTPFDEQLEVDFDNLGALIDWQIECDTQAIVVCATTGECATLLDREWEQIVDFTVRRVKERVPVIAGAGRNDTLHTLSLCRKAEKLGVQGVLLVTPYYNKTTQKGLVEHYTFLAQQTSVPILLYNVPSRTGMSFAAETYAELANCPTIYGVKEASGDFGLMLKMRKLCPPDFALYSGNDDQIVPVMSLGGLGVISTMANVIPKQTQEICTLWQQGKLGCAMKAQIRYQPLISALFREVNPIPVKAALEMMGRDSGNLRLPLTKIGCAAETELKNAMQKLELL